jgi:hypothetical protein
VCEYIEELNGLGAFLSERHAKLEETPKRREKSYYRKINPELARRFQAAMESAVEAASHQPFAMQVLEYEVRRWPLESFPHGVL